MEPKEPVVNPRSRSSFSQMKLRIAIQKRKKDKKDKQISTQDKDPIQYHPKDQSLAKKRVVLLKAKKKHLLAKDYAEARTLAASISQKTTREQAQWLSNHLMTWQEKSPKNEEDVGSATLSPDALLSLPKLSAQLQDNILAIDPHIADTSSLKTGEPKMIIISPAAMNIVNVHKQCPNLKIQKLFAKHIKINEQIDILKTTKIAIGGCTPNRLQKLVESGALLLDKLQYIILDTSLDGKQRTMFDIPEVSHDFWMLWSRYLAEKVNSCGVKMVICAVSGPD